MSAAGRKHAHRAASPVQSARQTRAGILILALIVALALAGALWAAGGVAVLIRAREALR